MTERTHAETWLRLLVTSTAVLAVALGTHAFDTAPTMGPWAVTADVAVLGVLAVGLAYVGRLIGLVIADTEQS
ncbi:MAG: hypothetical protein AAF467_19185 [Actinomycetota bacterium]